MFRNKCKDDLCELLKEGIEKLKKNGSTSIQVLTDKSQNAQLAQLLNTDYISEESRLRAEEALAFHESEIRQLYSNQRIPNNNDDLSELLTAGVEKIKTHGSMAIKVLTAKK